MAASKQKVVKTFSQERETKNTFRYKEDRKDDKSNSIYLDKESAKKLGDPENLKVTYESDDE